MPGLDWTVRTVIDKKIYEMKIGRGGAGRNDKLDRRRASRRLRSLRPALGFSCS